MKRSYQDQADLACPACGRNFQASLWLIVDAQERPDLAAAVSDGSIHRASCPHCGAAGSITAPLLYHDEQAGRLAAFLPLSVTTADEARSVVGDLHRRLVAAIPAAERRTYLASVALLPDLEALSAEAGVEEREAIQLQQALAQLIDAVDAETFRAVLVEHRRLLMSAEADQALDSLIDRLRAEGEAERARRAVEQRAMLGRFRSALYARRSRMADLLDRLAPLSAAEARVVEPLRAMLEAIDSQEVYAARIALEAAQLAVVDELIARLIAQAADESDQSSVEFLEALRRLTNQ